MFLVDFLKKILKRTAPLEPIKPKQSIYSKIEEIQEIHSIWDYIKLNENSQAAHLCGIVGFEEWVSMEEILRRVKEVFGIEGAIPLTHERIDEFFKKYSLDDPEKPYSRQNLLEEFLRDVQAYFSEKFQALHCN